MYMFLLLYNSFHLILWVSKNEKSSYITQKSLRYFVESFDIKDYTSKLCYDTANKFCFDEQPWTHIYVNNVLCQLAVIFEVSHHGRNIRQKSMLSTTMGLYTVISLISRYHWRNVFCPLIANQRCPPFEESLVL